MTERQRTTRLHLALGAAMLFLAACSDAGTRVAHDIEEGVERLGAEEGARVSISHVPGARPQGCVGPYTLVVHRGMAVPDGQGNFRVVAPEGGLGVSCTGPSGEPSGGSTTYHLRFVEVPITLEVQKKGGEATVIEIERVNGKPVLVGLR